MHIAIDAVGAKEGGAATILHSLLASAVRRHDVDKVTVFCSPRSCRSFEVPPSPKVVVEEKPFAEKRVWRLAWHLLGLPMAVRAHKADALLCLSGGGLAPPTVPSVMVVQQMLVFSSEARRQIPFREKLRLQVISFSMRLACAHCHRIVVQTATVRGRVVEQFGIDPAKIEVVVPAGDLPERDQAPCAGLVPMRETPSDRRVLYVGANWPYKNLRRLVAAVEQLSHEIAGLKLFVTLPMSDPLCRLPWVVGLGYLSRGALREAYEEATVLVMPSLVETVGLPMLEAASVGLPVLAADRPYARDVCGRSAAYFDPLLIDDLVAVLRTMLLNRELRMELGRCGRDLAARRAATEPYQRIIDIVCGVARRTVEDGGRKAWEPCS